MKSKDLVVFSALMGLAVFACSPGDGQRSPGASDSEAPPIQDSSPAVQDSEKAVGAAVPGSHALQALGEAVYSEGQIDSARVLFQRALVEARRSQDSAAVARSLTWLSQASWRLGDYTDTRQMGEEALTLKLRLGLDDELFRSYNVLGLLAWNQSRLTDAADLLGKATGIATASADSANLAKVRNNLALVHTSLGAFEEARRGFLEARLLAHAVEDPLIEGRVLINLAMLSTEMGDPRSAVDQLQEAQPLLRAADDPIGTLSALGHLGAAYSALGELGHAIACLDSALHQARSQGLRQEEASNLEQLAELNREAGNLRRSLQLLENAGEINADLELRDELATDLVNEAKIRGRLGNPELALLNAAEALAIHREIGAPLREVEDLVVLGELSQQAGQHEEALAFLADGDRIADALGARTARVAAALGRARVAAQAGDPGEVLRALEETRDDLSQGGYDLEWEVRSLRARAYSDLGSLQMAAEEGRRAIAAIERVRSAFSSGVLRDSYMRERAATYEHQVTVLLALNRLEEAFETADAARGRALLEGMAATSSSGSESHAGLVQNLADGDRTLRQIEELTRTLEEIQSVSTEEGLDEELHAQIEDLSSQREALRSEYAAALVRAQERDPQGMALLGGKRPDTAEILEALNPGEALLEYLVRSDGVLLFVASREGIRRIETRISRDRLSSRVRVAREALRVPDGGIEAGRVALQRLYETLVAPAVTSGALSGIGRLIVVSHAELSYLPFAALRSPQGRYLIEDFVITHLPNASSVTVFRGREPQRPGESEARVRAFAPFPRDLPGSDLELDAVRDVTGDARTYRGSEATEDQFRQALRSGDLIHAATHGIMNARNPMFSRLELAPGPYTRSPNDPGGTASDRANDGRLEVHEILRATVGAPLVFLSGCETAAGAGWSTTYGRGEEYATLAQAFLHAGADNVLATLWRIDDPGAAVFSGHFYAELYRGASPAQALATAQRAMLKDPELRAPFLWAGYVLMGTGDGWVGANSGKGVR